MDTTTPLKIKALVDENGEYFSPVIAAESIYTMDGKPYETELNNKLEAVNLISSDSVTITKDGKDCTFEVNFGATDNIIDNLDTTVAGQGPLDARQGNVLKNLIPDIVDNLTTNDASKTLSAKQGVELKKIAVPTGGSAGQVLKKATDANHSLEWGDAADPNAIVGDGSIMKIIELTYAEYKTLESNGELKEDTEYHITDVENGTASYKTEAQIQEQINNSIKTKLDLKDGVTLVEGQDLNDIIAPGTYLSSNSTITNSLLNTPSNINSGFVMIVFRDRSSSDSTKYYRQEIKYGRATLIRRTTDMGATWTPWEIIPTYAIGDVFITSTNENPEGRLGGTWQLIDKEFSGFTKKIEDTDTIAQYVTNGEGGTVTAMAILRTGHYLFIRLYITANVAIGDTATTLCTLNLEAFGVSGLAYATTGFIVGADGGNGVVNISINDEGIVQAVDVIHKYGEETLIVGATPRIAFRTDVPYNYMNDDVCNKFYWKRTA